MGRGRKIVLVADRAFRESNMIKCVKSLKDYCTFLTQPITPIVIYPKEITHPIQTVQMLTVALL